MTRTTTPHHRQPLTARLLLTSAICLSFAACNEDPELVRKKGEQEVEIAKLRGELALVQERLKRLPPDKSGELEAAKAETRKLEEEHKTLAAEVEGLESELRKIKDEYEAYKRKYSVR